MSLEIKMTGDKAAIKLIQQSRSTYRPLGGDRGAEGREEATELAPPPPHGLSPRPPGAAPHWAPPRPEGPQQKPGAGRGPGGPTCFTWGSGRAARGLVTASGELQPRGRRGKLGRGEGSQGPASPVAGEAAKRKRRLLPTGSSSAAGRLCRRLHDPRTPRHPRPGDAAENSRAATPRSPVMSGVARRSTSRRLARVRAPPSARRQRNPPHPRARRRREGRRACALSARRRRRTAGSAHSGRAHRRRDVPRLQTGCARSGDPGF
nr:collagen alpha-1(I) chain-like [Peromyscus maniculatus bairdii]